MCISVEGPLFRLLQCDSKFIDIFKELAFGFIDFFSPLSQLSFLSMSWISVLLFIVPFMLFIWGFICPTFSGFVKWNPRSLL